MSPTVQISFNPGWHGHDPVIHPAARDVPEKVDVHSSRRVQEVGIGKKVEWK